MASGGSNGDLMSFEDDQKRKNEKTGSVEESKIEARNGASTEGTSGQLGNPEQLLKIAEDNVQKSSSTDEPHEGEEDHKKNDNERSDDFAKTEQKLLSFLEKGKIDQAQDLITKMETYTGLLDKNQKTNSLRLSIEKRLPDIALQLIAYGRQSIPDQSYWKSETEWACHWLLKHKDVEIQAHFQEVFVALFKSMSPKNAKNVMKSDAFKTKVAESGVLNFFRGKTHEFNVLHKTIKEGWKNLAGVLLSIAKPGNVQDYLKYGLECANKASVRSTYESICIDLLKIMTSDEANDKDFKSKQFYEPNTLPNFSIQLFLKQSRMTNVMDNLPEGGGTLLHFLLSNSKNYNQMIFCILQGYHGEIDINVKSTDGKNCLHLAFEKSNRTVLNKDNKNLLSEHPTATPEAWCAKDNNENLPIVMKLEEDPKGDSVPMDKLPVDILFDLIRSEIPDEVLIQVYQKLNQRQKKAKIDNMPVIFWATRNRKLKLVTEMLEKGNVSRNDLEFQSPQHESNTILHLLASSDDKSSVKDIVLKILSRDDMRQSQVFLAKNKDSQTPFLVALKHGSTELASKFFNHKPEVACHNITLPLLLAKCLDQEGLELLDKIAKTRPNESEIWTNQGLAALQMVVTNPNSHKLKDAAKIILSKPLSLNHSAGERWTDANENNALHLAVMIGDIDIAQMVIAATMEPSSDRPGLENLVHAKNKDGRTPLHLAAIADKTMNQLKEEILSLPMASLTTKDNAGNTPIHMLTASNDYKLMRRILDKRNNITFQAEDWKNLDGDTPLDLAVAKKLAKCVETLNSYPNLNMTFKDEAGIWSFAWNLAKKLFSVKHKNVQAFIHEAALKMDDRHFKDLLKEAPEDIDWNKLNDNQDTPLSLTIKNRKETKAILLIESGKCDFTKTDQKGRNPLHLAVIEESKDIVKTLLTIGQDLLSKVINAPDNNGLTPGALLIQKMTPTETGIKLELLEVLLKSPALKLISNDGKSNLLLDALMAKNVAVLRAVLKLCCHTTNEESCACSSGNISSLPIARIWNFAQDDLTVGLNLMLDHSKAHPSCSKAQSRALIENTDSLKKICQDKGLSNAMTESFPAEFLEQIMKNLSKLSSKMDKERLLLLALSLITIQEGAGGYTRDLIKILPLGKNIDCQHKTESGETVLHLAATVDQDLAVQLVDSLSAKSLDMDDNKGRKVLQDAISDNQDRLVATLLDRQASLGFGGGHGHALSTALESARKSPQAWTILEKVLDKSDDQDCQQLITKFIGKLGSKSKFLFGQEKPRLSIKLYKRSLPTAQEFRGINALADAIESKESEVAKELSKIVNIVQDRASNGDNVLHILLKHWNNIDDKITEELLKKAKQLWTTKNKAEEEPLTLLFKPKSSKAAKFLLDKANQLLPTTILSDLVHVDVTDEQTDEILKSLPPDFKMAETFLEVTRLAKQEVKSHKTRYMRWLRHFLQDKTMTEDPKIGQLAGKDGNTVLHNVVMLKDEEVLKETIRMMDNIDNLDVFNARNTDDRTPLLEAINFSEASSALTLVQEAPQGKLSLTDCKILPLMFEKVQPEDAAIWCSLLDAIMIQGEKDAILVSGSPDDKMTPGFYAIRSFKTHMKPQKFFENACNHLLSNTNVILRGQDEDGNNSLHMAIQIKDCQFVTNVTEKLAGEEFNQTNKKQVTPLELAIDLSRGQDQQLNDIVRSLLTHKKISIDIKLQDQDHVLHWAVRQDDTDIVKECLDKLDQLSDPDNVNKDWENKDQQTPMDLALSVPHEKSLQVLLTHNGSLRFPISKDTDIWADKYVQDLPYLLFKYIHNVKKADEKVPLEDNKSFLHFAAQKGKTELVDRRLKEEAEDIDVNVQDDLEETPLMAATKAEALGVIDCLLLQSKTRLDILDKDKKNVFHHAIKTASGTSNVILQKFIDAVQAEEFQGSKEEILNAQDNDDNTPLHLVVKEALLGESTNNQEGTIDMIVALLDTKSVQANILDKNNETVLHLAMRRVHQAVTLAILGHCCHGPDPQHCPARKSATDSDIDLPLAIVYLWEFEETKRSEILKALLNHGDGDVGACGEEQVRSLLVKESRHVDRLLEVGNFQLLRILATEWRSKDGHNLLYYLCEVNQKDLLQKLDKEKVKGYLGDQKDISAAVEVAIRNGYLPLAESLLDFIGNDNEVIAALTSLVKERDEPSIIDLIRDVAKEGCKNMFKYLCNDVANSGGEKVSHLLLRHIRQNLPEAGKKAEEVETVLHAICEGGSKEIFDTYCEHIMGDDGLTSEEIAAYLNQKSPDKDNTAFHIAAKNSNRDYVDIILALIDKNADASATNKVGDTFLQMSSTIESALKTRFDNAPEAMLENIINNPDALRNLIKLGNDDIFQVVLKRFCLMKTDKGIHPVPELCPYMWDSREKLEKSFEQLLKWEISYHKNDQADVKKLSELREDLKECCKNNVSRDYNVKVSEMISGLVPKQMTMGYYGGHLFQGLFILYFILNLSDFVTDITLIFDYVFDWGGTLMDYPNFNDCHNSTHPMNTIACDMRQVQPRTFYTYAILIMVTTIMCEFYFVLERESAEQFKAAVSGRCCPHGLKASGLWWPFGILTFFVQSLVIQGYEFFVKVFVSHWKNYKSNYKQEEVKDDCSTCHGCQDPVGTCVCLSCHKNALERIPILVKMENNAQLLRSKCKILTASTENALMPLLQMLFLFPKVIFMFPKASANLPDTKNLFDVFKYIGGNWRFIVTVISIVLSILSMATALTELYFTKPGKRQYKNLKRWGVYFASIIFQVLARLMSFQAFAFGIVANFWDPNEMIFGMLVVVLGHCIFLMVVYYYWQTWKAANNNHQGDQGAEDLPDWNWNREKCLKPFKICLVVVRDFVLLVLLVFVQMLGWIFTKLSQIWTAIHGLCNDQVTDHLPRERESKWWRKRPFHAEDNVQDHLGPPVSNPVDEAKDHLETSFLDVKESTVQTLLNTSKTVKEKAKVSAQEAKDVSIHLANVTMEATEAAAEETKKAFQKAGEVAIELKSDPEKIRLLSYVGFLTGLMEAMKHTLGRERRNLLINSFYVGFSSLYHLTDFYFDEEDSCYWKEKKTKAQPPSGEQSLPSKKHGNETIPEQDATNPNVAVTIEEEEETVDLSRAEDIMVVKEEESHENDAEQEQTKPLIQQTEPEVENGNDFDKTNIKEAKSKRLPYHTKLKQHLLFNLLIVAENCLLCSGAFYIKDEGFSSRGFFLVMLTLLFIGFTFQSFYYLVLHPWASLNPGKKSLKRMFLYCVIFWTIFLLVLTVIYLTKSLKVSLIVIVVLLLAVILAGGMRMYLGRSQKQPKNKAEVEHV